MLVVGWGWLGAGGGGGGGERGGGGGKWGGEGVAEVKMVSRKRWRVNGRGGEEGGED